VPFLRQYEKNMVQPDRSQMTIQNGACASRDRWTNV